MSVATSGMIPSPVLRVQVQTVRYQWPPARKVIRASRRWSVRCG